jgi:hypothetical protein
MSDLEIGRRAVVWRDQEEVEMKNLVYRILVAGMGIAGIGAAQAQDRSITADVPFDFYLGTNAMPHGAYRVEQMINGNVVTLRTAEAVKSTTSWGIVGNSENEQARLVFRCYGQSCFLSEVWPGSGRTGLAVPRGAREEELAKDGASSKLALVRIALE